MGFRAFMRKDKMNSRLSLVALDEAWIRILRGTQQCNWFSSHGKANPTLLLQKKQESAEWNSMDMFYAWALSVRT